MATYSKTSPYYSTGMFGQFLDIMDDRKVSPYPDDVSYTIDNFYQYRPDVLAHDLYGDSKLWWVFARRNPNVLKDPIFDFRAGVTIYIPQQQNLTIELGL